MKSKAVLVAFLVIVLNSPAAEPAPADPAADPALAARIEKAIGKLASPKFQERESAAKELEAIGGPASGALEKASKEGDAEAAFRAQEILQEIAKTWVSPEVQRKIEALRKARQPEEWKKLWDEIQGAGEAARNALARELSTPSGKASLALQEVPARVKRGEGFELKAVLKNEGEKGLWVSADCVRVKDVEKTFWSAEKADDENARINKHAFADGARLGRSVKFEQPAPPPVPYLYLQPGETLEARVKVPKSDLDFVGAGRIAVSYDPDHRADPRGRKAVRVAVGGEGMPPGLQESVAGVSEPVEVVPALDAPPQGMSLAFTDGSKPAAGPGGIAVKLTLANAGDKPVSIPPPMENGVPRGLWYALLDAKGNVAQCGSLAGPEKREWAAPNTLLDPAKTLEASGSIVPAVPPGQYRLVCGYSAHPSTFDALQKFLQGNRQVAVRAAAVGGRGMPVQKDNAKELAHPNSPGAQEWSGDALTPPADVEIR